MTGGLLSAYFGIDSFFTLLKLSHEQKYTLQIDLCKKDLIFEEEIVVFKINKTVHPSVGIDIFGFVGGSIDGAFTANIGGYVVMTIDTNKREASSAFEVRGQIYGSLTYSYNVFGKGKVDPVEIHLAPWTDKKVKGTKKWTIAEKKTTW